MSGLSVISKKDIPIFTDQIYTFLTKDGTAKLLEEYISTQLKTYTKGTFAETDYRLYNTIIKKHKAENQIDAVATIQTKIEENQRETRTYYMSLGGIFLVMVFLLFLYKNPSSLEYLIQILYSLSLLFLGVFLPMISIDARITELSFSFLGEQIVFNNQILFYRSKSIMEVVDILFLQERWDLILVGILILLFSVLFPVSKLIASVFYAFGKKLKENRIIKFFVFKTGKWSMADVFVIALFMAYLGFDGILSEQLNQFQYTGESAKVISTSQSDLLFGFYAFTAFVLMSLFISQRIKKLK